MQIFYFFGREKSKKQKDFNLKANNRHILKY